MESSLKSRSIRVWDLSTQREVQQLDGHDSFVYSVAALPSGEIISGGEDRSMRVWSADSRELLQTITLPAISGRGPLAFVASMAQVGSVWSVTAMPSGDIAAGTSDGVVRVFSRAVERQAEQALQDVRRIAFSAIRLLTSSRTGIRCYLICYCFECVSRSSEMPSSLLLISGG